ncbi:MULTISPECIES: hypothetical protein [unclassified Blastococcus]|uniref:hypothetical protein n=1 Tax=unclassified Blastococcus TaxID=2619396 RepID=UPI001EF0D27F|nr:MULTISPECIES: hypothetical protein [unclassified Blastococcus]
MNPGPGGRGVLLTGSRRGAGAAAARAPVVEGARPPGALGTDHLTGAMQPFDDTRAR